MRDLNLNHLEIGIVSSRTYDDSLKVRKVLQSLIDKPYSFKIYSGGTSLGGEFYIKQYCLEYDFNYREFNPIHTGWNQYSALPQFRYGKTYRPYNFISRYKYLVERCSRVIIFYNREEEEDKNMEECIEFCRKFEKPFIIIE